MACATISAGPSISTYPPAKLRALRHRAGLSASEVCRLTGLAETTLWHLETGKHRPQPSTLHRVLTLYANLISQLEGLDLLWGEDGLRRPNREALAELVESEPSLSPSLLTLSA